MGKVRQRAVLRCPGINFPTPYPQGYGATPPLPRPAQSACDVSRSMPEADPYGNAACAVHRRSGPGRLPSVTGRSRIRRPSGPRARPPHPEAAAEWITGPSPTAGSASGPLGPPESHRARSGPSAPFPAAPHGRGGDTGPSGGIRSLPVAIAPFRTISRPTCPGGAKKRLITRVVRRFNDRITYAQPSIFSQLHTRAHSLPNWPINPLVTRQEETARYASTQRGRAMNARRTSLHALRMKRFVIECFPPSCLVDIAPVGELVTPAPRDAVDSILGIECLGNSCRTEGNSAGATGP